MISSDIIVSLADAFHEAALQPELWNAALQRLGDAMGESAVVLAAYTPSRSFQLSEGVRFNAERHEHVLAEHGSPGTNRYIRLMQESPPASVLHPRAMMTDREWHSDPINAKFIRPEGLQDGLTGPLIHDGAGFASFALFRSSHYERQDIEFMRVCAMHLRHALKTRLHLGRLEATARNSLAALDSIRIGILLTDSTCRVLHMNASAEAMMRRADGLTIGRGGVLAASRQDEMATLKRLVGSASRSAGRSMRSSVREHSAIHHGGAFQISRPSGGRAWSLLAAPLRASTFMEFGVDRQAASAILFLFDPDQPSRPAARLIAEAHGLTPKEAELAGYLLSEFDLQAAADRMKVSPNTAKTLLKRGFERTGVRRQSELIKLILDGPLGTWGGGEADSYESHYPFE